MGRNELRRRLDVLLVNPCRAVPLLPGCVLSPAICNSFSSSHRRRPLTLQPAGANQYDLSAKCNGSIETNLCYPLTQHITDYLNTPSVRDNLGISGKVGNFTSCSTTVAIDFALKADMFRTSESWVSELLERDVKVLIYVGKYDVAIAFVPVLTMAIGKYDWVCNWVGNLAWVSALPWSQSAEFNAKSFEEWQADGERAGDIKSAGPLTFLTIEKAGHMVSYLNRTCVGTDRSCV